MHKPNVFCNFSSCYLCHTCKSDCLNFPKQKLHALESKGLITLATVHYANVTRQEETFLCFNKYNTVYPGKYYKLIRDTEN